MMISIPRWTYLLGAFCLVTAGAFSIATTAKMGRQPDGSYLIPTGQTLTPAGRHIEVNDRPMGMAFSPDGRSMAVVTGSNFGTRSLHLVDLASEQVTQSISLGNSFVGVAFSQDGSAIYIGGGAGNDIKFYKKGANGQFAADGTNLTIASSNPSGLALGADGKRLFVALNTKHTVAVVDVDKRTATEIAVGTYPYTVLLSKAGDKLYVSNWGGRRPANTSETDGIYPVTINGDGMVVSGTISVIDTATLKVLKEIPAGLHPSGMTLSPDGSTLYVANANSDSISVINTAADQVDRTIDVRLYSGAPLGSAPNALAVSRDGSKLYVANGANNAVAVVEPSRKDGPLRGFIPTGWFPAAVALSPAGDRLVVASGYGFGSIAPIPASRGSNGRQYSDRMGVVSFLDMPSEETLAAYTRQVMMNNLMPGRSLTGSEQIDSRQKAVQGHPLPMHRAAAASSPIQHVFYIIKENRTYDQVFGDLPKGNGDPTLVQFGRDVTPNQHAMVEKYVLLDNFYTVGDQSALGHEWCMAAYASDWAYKYGNGRNDMNPMKRAPTGFIWDNARRHGKSVRIYGEWGSSVTAPSNAKWTDFYKSWLTGSGKTWSVGARLIPNMKDIYATEYAAYDLRVPEQVRADQFLDEFRQFEQDGKLPHLVIIRMGNDHTNGTTPDYPTPRALVADNDLAIGRVVEAISKSRYWSSSAIFITEDDAQNGTDHVDGHRTVGLVVSPWARRNSVDSTMYTTISMVRTIEQILGLPPMNQYDLAAEPMFNAFALDADNSPFTVLPNQIPLDEMNPALSATTGLQRRLALASMKMDFKEADEADEDTLNRIIWHSVKGYDKPFPSATK